MHTPMATPEAITCPEERKQKTQLSFLKTEYQSFCRLGLTLMLTYLVSIDVVIKRENGTKKSGPEEGDGVTANRKENQSHVNL